MGLFLALCFESPQGSNAFRFPLLGPVLRVPAGVKRLSFFPLLRPVFRVPARVKRLSFSSSWPCASSPRRGQTPFVFLFLALCFESPQGSSAFRFPLLGPVLRVPAGVERLSFSSSWPCTSSPRRGQTPFVFSSSTPCVSCPRKGQTPFVFLFLALCFESPQGSNAFRFPLLGPVLRVPAGFFLQK